jgi:TctA family transporter
MLAILVIAVILAIVVIMASMVTMVIVMVTMMVVMIASKGIVAISNKDGDDEKLVHLQLTVHKIRELQHTVPLRLLALVLGTHCSKPFRTRNPTVQSLGGAGCCNSNSCHSMKRI